MKYSKFLSLLFLTTIMTDINAGGGISKIKQKVLTENEVALVSEIALLQSQDPKWKNFYTELNFRSATFLKYANYSEKNEPSFELHCNLLTIYEMNCEIYQQPYKTSTQKKFINQSERYITYLRKDESARNSLANLIKLNNMFSQNMTTEQRDELIKQHADRYVACQQKMSALKVKVDKPAHT